MTFSMTCWNKHRAAAVWWHLAATRCWGDFIQDTSLAPEAVKKKRSLEQLRRIGWALFVGGLCFRKWPWAEDERGQVSEGLLATCTCKLNPSHVSTSSFPCQPLYIDTNRTSITINPYKTNISHINAFFQQQTQTAPNKGPGPCHTVHHGTRSCGCPL